MEKLFYRFRPEDRKDCIRIRAKVKYNTLQMPGVDSPLIENNVFTVASGKKWFDVIQFIESSGFAISRKMMELLKVNNVTGWSSFPIVINGAMDDYYAFQTVGKAGPILNLPALNSFKTDITEFDETTWDGSEIFNLQNTLLVACVPRVKEILEEASVTNVLIQRL
jgi:hypothetical protein